MRKIIINHNTMKSIANAIRIKNNKQEEYLPSEMPNAILNIETGGKYITFTKTKYPKGLIFLHRKFYVDSEVNVSNSATKLNVIVTEK